jgi:hypothetical protein
MVEPKEKLPGSTWVACWLLALLNLSELNWVSGTVAAGSEANGLLGVEFGCELEPQLATKRMAALTPKTRARRLNVKAASPGLYIREKTSHKVHRTSSLSQYRFTHNPDPSLGYILS